MTQGRLVPRGTPGWEVLAHGQRESDSISRCPGGHIHLDYGKLTVRFDPDEFLTFARMVAEAAARLNGHSLSGTPLDHNPAATFSLN